MVKSRRSDREVYWPTLLDKQTCGSVMENLFWNVLIERMSKLLKSYFRVLDKHPLITMSCTTGKSKHRASFFKRCLVNNFSTRRTVIELMISHTLKKLNICTTFNCIYTCSIINHFLLPYYRNNSLTVTGQRSGHKTGPWDISHSI